jgi:hypothetical protein
VSEWAVSLELEDDSWCKGTEGKADAEYLYCKGLFSTDHSSGDRHLLTLINNKIFTFDFPNCFSTLCVRNL